MVIFEPFLEQLTQSLTSHQFTLNLVTRFKVRVGVSLIEELPYDSQGKTVYCCYIRTIKPRELLLQTSCIFRVLPHPFSYCRCKPQLHLGSCSISEGHHEELINIRFALEDYPQDPLDEDRCFARPRRSGYQHRLIKCFYRLYLFRRVFNCHTDILTQLVSLRLICDTITTVTIRGIITPRGLRPQ